MAVGSSLGNGSRAGHQCSDVSREELASCRCRSLCQVMRIPKVEVADLRALDADNGEEVARRHLECGGVARQRHELGKFGQLRACGVVKRGIERCYCTTEYVSTDSALRRAAASGGGSLLRALSISQFLPSAFHLRNQLRPAV